MPWSRRSLGGSSVFQAVPALNQYWHPWLLGGRASGIATVGDERWELDGWQVYAEKNWGAGGFPEAWWWGQAQGFDEPGACVAFAGGKIHSGPLRTEVTAVVVRLPDGRLLRLGDPIVSPTRARVTDESWSLRARSAALDRHGRGRLAARQRARAARPAAARAPQRARARSSISAAAWTSSSPSAGARSGAARRSSPRSSTAGSSAPSRRRAAAAPRARDGAGRAGLT